MPVKARSLVSLRISDMSICCRDTALFFWGRLIYGKDARKVRYVQNMEQTIQGAFHVM
ncbi:hypothetical protein MYD03_00165 [Mediterraneibacter gnavus]